MPIVFFVALASGFIGAFWALSKNKSPILWGLLCFFFPLIGIIFLAMSEAEDSPEEKIAKALTNAGVAGGAVGSASQSTVDMTKWNTLVELDSEISAAASAVRQYGPRYERMLAEKYLALNDKHYLSAAVGKVVEIAEAERDTIGAREREEAEFMASVVDTGEVRGFKSYTMRDGKIAVECKDGVRRTFDSRQEAISYLVFNQ